MIKKILLWIVLLVVVAGVVGYFYFSAKLNESFASIVDASESTFVESCGSDQACIDSVEKLFPECRKEYTVEEVNLISFQEESAKFLTVINDCIQERTEVNVPSVWEHILKKELGE